jgi:FKBP-type peptidyl-prolyl cis-trans isomerase 2
MSQAKAGDTVRVHYTGRLDADTIFDSSDGKDPLEFKLGSGMVIEGFDSGITGMTIGEKKTIEIPVDKAYGPVNPEMIINFKREQLPPDLDPEIGQQLQMQAPEGQTMVVTVIDKNETEIKLDGNHDLAGKDLIFDLELVEIS